MQEKLIISPMPYSIPIDIKVRKVIEKMMFEYARFCDNRVTSKCKLTTFILPKVLEEETKYIYETMTDEGYEIIYSESLYPRFSEYEILGYDDSSNDIQMVGII